MARRQQVPANPDSVSKAELQQLGLWGIAAQVGLEPAYSKQDLGSNKPKKQNKKAAFTMEKWKNPFFALTDLCGHMLGTVSGRLTQTITTERNTTSSGYKKRVTIAVNGNG